MVFPGRWTLGLVAACVLMLASCNSTSSPPKNSDHVKLDGLWLVTPGPGTAFGSGGTTTLEFGPDESGSATFLSRSDANDILSCRKPIYAAVSNKVVLLDGEYYSATESSDQIVLTNGTDLLTLSRVVGTPPVAPCETASATEVDAINVRVGGFSTLDAYQSRLYFNIDDGNESVVPYDVTTGSLGVPRAYSMSVSGGTHRWVVAARSDDLFYGHCGCGGSTSLDRFDLSLNTSIAHVELDTGLGVNMGVRFGYFAGSTIVIGGYDRDNFNKNTLVTLNADTLALISQRQVLDDAYVRDITLVNGRMIALVGDSIIVVGIDGRADETIQLQGIASASPRGITAIGSTVYVLDATASGDVMLYSVTLP